MDHEENISAEQQAPQEEARVSGADAHQERPQGTERTAAQGTQARCCLRPKRLPGFARLKNRVEFRRVYDEGLRVACRHLVLFARVRSEGSVSRLGVTASRKVGGAVERSRCRRRLRELFRLYFESEIALDVVLNARRSCSVAPWLELCEDFARAIAVTRRRFAGVEAGSRGGGVEPEAR